jgi:hypothetical protein
MKIYDGNIINVKIIDFKQIKDVNDWFENKIKEILNTKA